MTRQKINEIFNKNEPLVYYVIKRRVFAPRKYGIDDLCQEGRIGLYKAILDYYENKPELQSLYKFSTVAYAYIFRCVRNYIVIQNKYYKRYFAEPNDKLSVKVDSEINNSYIDLIELDVIRQSEDLMNISKKLLTENQIKTLDGVMRCQGNLSEFARINNVSRQAISYRYNRIIRKLRDSALVQKYYKDCYTG